MGGRIGVDEAGRGPVLGSMFVAAVALPERVALPEGVADSKTLAAERRRDLASRLEDDLDVGIAVSEVTATEIDENAGSLVDLLVRATADCLDELGRPGWPAILDAGEADVERYVERVERRTAVDRPLDGAVGADETVPIVSAASIVAKERRERHVAALRGEYGEVGSGYPSDPRTRRYLAERVEATGDLPDCARRTWRTSRDVLAAAEQADFGAFR